MPWECSTISMLQFLATVPSRGPVYLSRVCIVAARIVYVIPIPFRLSQISCFTLASNVSPLTLTISQYGDWALFQFPHLPRAGPGLLTLPFSPFMLVSFVRFSIFFSSQLLLSILGSCSESTSLSEGISISSVAQSCPTFCDLMNHSTLGLPVHHQLLEFTQTHVH